MKVTTGCSSDFINRNIREISPEDLVAELQSDKSLHEVIDANAVVRLYFDIDKKLYPQYRLLNNRGFVSSLLYVLQRLNSQFNTTDSDWAISDCTRPTKESYHIISKKYCCKITELQDIYRNYTIPYADKSIIITTKDRNLRLPNQSKYVDGQRTAGPARIIQGDLRDFFVTDTTGLTPWRP